MAPGPHRPPPAERAMARELERHLRIAAGRQGREDEIRFRLARRWERVHRRLVRAGLQHADPRILEVGSGAHGLVFGTGSTRAVGVDPLAVAYAGLYPAWQGTVPTVAAVGEHLPFAGASFDVVLCADVVDRCAHPTGMAAEMVRVLVPGGLLFLAVDVHHRLYSLAHHVWRVAGRGLDFGPFADRTGHLTPSQARALLAGLPIDVRSESTYRAEARERARRRRVRHPGHLLPMILFRNAGYVVVAQRR